MRNTRAAGSLPTMLRYSVHAENNSLYNTPPVFAIYIIHLVLKWLLSNGGLGQAVEAAGGRLELVRAKPPLFALFLSASST